MSHQRPVSRRPLSLSDICRSSRFESFALWLESVVARRRRLFLEDAACSDFRRSMSAMTWAKERNSTSACASVESSSIVMLSSLQYCELSIGLQACYQKRSNLQNFIKLFQDIFSLRSAMLEKKNHEPQPNIGGSCHDAILVQPVPRIERIRGCSSPSTAPPKVGGHRRRRILAWMQWEPNWNISLYRIMWQW